jgi:hypothetical protein
MSEEGAPKAGGPEPAAAGHAWAWPVALMVSVLIIALAALYVFKSCRDLPGETIDKTGKVVERIGSQLTEVAAAFNRGTITTTFTSYATSVSGSQFLQFATLSQHERFTRTDEATTAFGYLPLPDVIVEANAPVTYTYFLDLNDKWDFKLQDGVVTVVAPDIKFNKPSVDASGITYEVRKDSLVRDTRQAMDALKKSISSLASQKARINVDLVRETGRKQTETFVQNWLARAFSDGKKYPVVVKFHSETPKEMVLPATTDR